MHWSASISTTTIQIKEGGDMLMVYAATSTAVLVDERAPPVHASRPSVIFFTTLSGAGYGLWFLPALGVPRRSAAAGVAAADGGNAVRPALVSAGLLASLSHLANHSGRGAPTVAVAQLRLSREALAALLTFLPALALLARSWPLHQPDATPGAAATVAALLLALGCGVTVALHGAHLPRSSHRRLAQPRVLPVYLLLGLYSGALWLWAWRTWPVCRAAPGCRRPLANAALVALGAMAGRRAQARLLARHRHRPTPGHAGGRHRPHRARPRASLTRPQRGRTT